LLGKGATIPTIPLTDERVNPEEGTTPTFSEQFVTPIASESVHWRKAISLSMRNLSHMSTSRI
jgi:hypothetical protein